MSNATLIASKGLPFSDVSTQTSPPILKIIEEVKLPLLLIYEIGVKIGCSHYKHFVRLCEYVLLTSPGMRLNFDFDREKTRKTEDSYQQNVKVSKEVKKEVLGLWKVAILNLGEIKGTNIHQRFVIFFLDQFMKKFAGGGNVRTFHNDKKLMFEMYNQTVRRGRITLFNTQKKKMEILESANVGVL